MIYIIFINIIAWEKGKHGAKRLLIELLRKIALYWKLCKIGKFKSGVLSPKLWNKIFEFLDEQENNVGKDGIISLIHRLKILNGQENKSKFY